MEELKSSFLKTYANIPLSLRESIVVTLDGEPITWKVAFIEVKGDTPRSKIILEKLKQLSIIEETP
jgi:hypothetical protein